ncbi:hypothetical protein V1511DRAFT_416436 [Dipodascopsis uninucleata]
MTPPPPFPSSSDIDRSSKSSRFLSVSTLSSRFKSQSSLTNRRSSNSGHNSSDQDPRSNTKPSIAAASFSDAAQHHRLPRKRFSSASSVVSSTSMSSVKDNEDKLSTVLGDLSLYDSTSKDDLSPEDALLISRVKSLENNAEYENSTRTPALLHIPSMGALSVGSSASLNLSNLSRDQVLHEFDLEIERTRDHFGSATEGSGGTVQQLHHSQSRSSSRPSSSKSEKLSAGQSHQPIAIQKNKPLPALHDESRSRSTLPGFKPSFKPISRVASVDEFTALPVDVPVSSTSKNLSSSASQRSYSASGATRSVMRTPSSSTTTLFLSETSRSSNPSSPPPLPRIQSVTSIESAPQNRSTSSPVIISNTSSSSERSSSFFNTDLLVSPTRTSSTSSEPIAPCPSDTQVAPYWLMRNLLSAFTSSHGGLITEHLRLPPQIFLQKGVKPRLAEEKTQMCEIISSSLNILQNEINAYNKAAPKSKVQELRKVLERMRNIENSMDKLEQQIGKRMKQASTEPSLGAPLSVQQSYSPMSQYSISSRKASSASSHSGGSNKSGDSGSTTSARPKQPSPASSQSSGSSFFKKLKSKTAAGLAKASSVGAPPLESLDKGGTGVQGVSPRDRYTNRGAAGAGSARYVPIEVLQSPLGAYVGALTNLFDRAQLVLQLRTMLDYEHTSTQVQQKIDHFHRIATKYFSTVICKFVLADITYLLDKFVKLGSRLTLGI